jgi:hypothetical protein
MLVTAVLDGEPSVPVRVHEKHDTLAPVEAEFVEVVAEGDLADPAPEDDGAAPVDPNLQLQGVHGVARGPHHVDLHGDRRSLRLEGKEDGLRAAAEGPGGLPGRVRIVLEGVIEVPVDPDAAVLGVLVEDQEETGAVAQWHAGESALLQARRQLDALGGLVGEGDVGLPVATNDTGLPLEAGDDDVAVLPHGRSGAQGSGQEQEESHGAILRPVAKCASG